MTFVGESGVDLGGIKREFFRLFMKELGNSIFMQGTGNNKFFSFNMPAIQVSTGESLKYIKYIITLLDTQRKDFMHIGWYAGISFVQGGPGFPLLADAVYQYLHTGKTSNVEINDEDLPLVIKELILQVI